jgi:transposase-like protein
MAASEYPALAALSENQRRRALERFQVLRPFLEEGVPLAIVARAHALSPRTARYWVRQYRQHGLAGLEKRLARYAQLYSRVGFVHQFRTLSTEEMQFILAHKWAQLGLTLAADDFTDAEAVAAIVRITSGNFRLIQRLFTQIERILQINELRTVTKEVVEAARESMVIGPL